MKRPGNWSRRHFLSARGLGASAGGFFGAVMPEDPPKPADAQEEVANWCFSRRAMGCEFTVFLPSTLPGAMAIGETALDEIGRLEDLLTVYRDDSLMSYVNRHAADGPVRVDHTLFTLFERSAELTRQTDGAFDVASGALVKAWGFLHGPRRVPDEAERRVALADSGMQHVVLDAFQSTVRFQSPGLEINLGSIGKGYALDKAIELIREEEGVSAAMIQGGRSSIYAHGSPTDDGRGWLVGVENPYNPSEQLASIYLRDRGLGTAGSAHQYFEADGRRFGHVIDPRTGWPVDADRGRGDIASASVIARDAATADALATALFVMGLDKAAEFCQNHRRVAALLVLRDGSDGDTSPTPRVVTFNLPPEDVILAPGDAFREGCMARRNQT